MVGVIGNWVILKSEKLQRCPCSQLSLYIRLLFRPLDILKFRILSCEQILVGFFFLKIQNTIHWSNPSSCQKVGNLKGQFQCHLVGVGKLQSSNGLNSGCCLVLCSPWAKCDFYVFKCLWEKNRIIIFCDMWKLYEIQISVSIKFYWNTATSISSLFSWAVLML